MGYRETLDWLYSLETMEIKFGLRNVSELLERLGNPHLKLRSVHVAGTNGKGSVCAMTSSVLREAGYKVGLYTSPHIVDFRERIQVNGVKIPDSRLLALVEDIKPFVEEMAISGPDRRLTFFEITTAIAFAYFADMGVEEAVVEVGMGGRLDATNVIAPDCTVITRISLEHTRYLGDTISKIAREKAGIIKPEVPVVTAEDKEDALAVLRSVAMDKRSPLRIVGRDIKYRLVSSTLEGTTILLDGLSNEVHVPLPGSYQASNVALSYGCLRELRERGVQVPDDAIVEGFGKVDWPGRIEVLSKAPLVILDASHTPDGATVVATDIKNLAMGRVILVLGVLNDKDLGGIAKHFGSIASMAIATSPDTKRAFPAAAVRDALREHCSHVEMIDDVGEAFARAMTISTRKDTVLVTGSLYTIGEGRRWWDSHKTR
jgi:dihydrofolate synthase/folylpolyglutamate synthase